MIVNEVWDEYCGLTYLQNAEILKSVDKKVSKTLLSACEEADEK